VNQQISAVRPERNHDREPSQVDIWESREALEKWGPEGFVPVLLDLGVELRPPEIHPVRNIIQS
jgi:hypothetical protein